MSLFCLESTRKLPIIKGEERKLLLLERLSLSRVLSPLGEKGKNFIYTEKLI